MKVELSEIEEIKNKLDRGWQKEFAEKSNSSAYQVCVWLKTGQFPQEKYLALKKFVAQKTKKLKPKGNAKKSIKRNKKVSSAKKNGVKKN